jgi:hypothetical protein
VAPSATSEFVSGRTIDYHAITRIVTRPVWFASANFLVRVNLRSQPSHLLIA